MTILSNHFMSKRNLGSKRLAIQTSYMHTLQEQLQTMLLLMNTDLDSSLERILNIYMICILSNQDAISSTNMEDLIAIGI